MLAADEHRRYLLRQTPSLWTIVPFTLVVLALDIGTSWFLGVVCAVNEDPTLRIVVLCPGPGSWINLTLAVPLLGGAVAIACAVVARRCRVRWIFGAGTLTAIAAGFYPWVVYA